MSIDSVQISFNGEVQLLLKLILGLIIFGVALDIRIADFKRVVEQPKGILIGLSLQFVAFPAATFLVVWLARQYLSTTFYPSIALGMFLLSACPGGNMSNFFTHLAGGNTALSVSMSAISTVAALVMTPLNFSFWGSQMPSTQALLTELAIDPIDMLQTITILLGVPLALGMSLAHYKPNLANRLKKGMKIFSITFFILLILGVLVANFKTFLAYVHTFAGVVFLQNSLALFLGYFGAKATGLPEKDCRTVSIEVGIQNSGLGLILFFQYFEHLGGMGLVVAWWGLWHMVSGLVLAFYWQKRPIAEIIEQVD